MVNKQAAIPTARKKRNRVKALIIGGCTAALVTGGSLAYFTDTDHATNNFTIADSLKIQVVEPNWNAANATNLTPLKTVAKDPSIKNVSGTSAWIIAQVKVPVADVVTVGTNGKKEATASKELFTYQLNSGWTEKGTPVLSNDGAYKIHTYLATNAIDINASTPNIFDSVTLINLVEGELTGSQLNQQIEVTGFGIQKEGFLNADAAWAAYKAQNELS